MPCVGKSRLAGTARGCVSAAPDKGWTSAGRASRGPSQDPGWCSPSTGSIGPGHRCNGGFVRRPGCERGSPGQQPSARRSCCCRHRASSPACRGQLEVDHRQVERPGDGNRMVRPTLRCPQRVPDLPVVTTRPPARLMRRSAVGRPPTVAGVERRAARGRSGALFPRMTGRPCDCAERTTTNRHSGGVFGGEPPGDGGVSDAAPGSTDRRWRGDHRQLMVGLVGADLLKRGRSHRLRKASAVYTSVTPWSSTCCDWITAAWRAA